MNLLIEQDAKCVLTGKGGWQGRNKWRFRTANLIDLFLPDLSVGQTVEVSFIGQVNSEDKMVKELTIPLASGAPFSVLR